MKKIAGRASRSQILMTNQPKTDINKVWVLYTNQPLLKDLVTHFLFNFLFNRFLPFFVRLPIPFAPKRDATRVKTSTCVWSLWKEKSLIRRRRVVGGTHSMNHPLLANWVTLYKNRRTLRKRTVGRASRRRIDKLKRCAINLRCKLKATTSIFVSIWQSNRSVVQ